MKLVLGQSSKKVDVQEYIFSCPFNEALVHQVVTAVMAGARAGTKAQKTRAEVSGGGIKPFRQKGTGRARAGTIRSPLWRKGGVVFAAKPRSYVQKINKKMFRGALRAIFSELIRQQRLLLIKDDFTQLESPKTRLFLQKIKALGLDGKVLIITENIEENFYLAVRNLSYVELKDSVGSIANPVNLINANHILVTEAAIKEVERLLQ